MTFSKILFSAAIPFFAAASFLGAADPHEEVDNPTRKHVKQTFLSLPLRFEENSGRYDAQVKYFARGPGYTLFLAPNETVLSVRKNKSKANVVRVRLDGAKPAPVMEGEGPFAAPTNYLVGNDPSKWRSATNYERVRFQSAYPGIDVLYHGKQHELEYDFEVAPGIDPAQIALRYEGVRKLRVDADGSLVMQLKDGTELRQPKPISYQMIDGERRDVASRYAIKGRNKVVFALGQYDRAQELVIDPVVLSYSTCIGGSGADSGNAVAVDASGHAYFAGQTLSSDFPTLNEYQTDLATNDVVVARFDPSASGAASLLYSTYLGGNGEDRGEGIAVDEDGNVYVTGRTMSTDFPTLGQYQTNQPLEDAFVTKLNTNISGGASLTYSTYLGGDGDDEGYGIALGTAGNVFIAGNTNSSNFPTAQQYQTDQPGIDAFVTKLDPTISGAGSLLYSTYLGGSGTDIAFGVATGAGGRVFVTGYTSSTNFPTLNQYQGDQTAEDAFVTKLNTGLSGAASLLYSTYLGGTGIDIAYGIAVDAEGDAYVVGYTESTDFPTLNQFQTDQAGRDTFVTRLNPDLSGASSLIYSTYLGGSALEEGRAIAVDDNGNAFVTGFSDSTNFPLLDALQTNQAGTDAFVSTLDTTASGNASLAFSTYLGGNSSDRGLGIAVDSGADIYVVGETDSPTFPLLNQYAARVGGNDGFLTKYRTVPANDSCASAQPVFLDEIVEGKTGGGTNDYQLSGAACFTGGGHTASTAAGRDVVYSFVAPSTGNYSFRVSNYSGAGNLVLYLASFCQPATGTPLIVTDCVGASNRTPGNTNFAAEEVLCHAVSAGVTVFIFVDEDAMTSGSNFTLQVTRCVRDVEANDTPATSNAFQFGIEGGIDSPTDVDFFLLGTFPADSRIFAMVDARAANDNNFDLRVTTSISTLEYDDADLDTPYGNLSATIAGTRLTATTPVWLRINTFAAAVASRPYRLYAVAQPPGANLDGVSATNESEPNNTTATADQAANNFFRGDLAPAPVSRGTWIDAVNGGGPSTDVDIFAFTAEAGELIFLSLDEDPRRNGTPVDARLALLDENGAVILQVNDGSSTSNTGTGIGSLTSLFPFSPAESIIHPTTASGTYYARVTLSPSAPLAASSGDYLLSITRELKFISAVSRKTHGAAGNFDIPLPLSGEPGVECRSSGGAHTLVITFNNPMLSGNATVTSGTGSASAPTFAGNTMTVNLTGVTDVQKITVTLSNVTDSVGQRLPNMTVSMNVLAGDVSGSKTVNATDVSQTKLQSGNATTATNFRSDVAVSGSINATDVSVVKLNSGHGVP